MRSPQKVPGDEPTGIHPDESELLDFSGGALGVAASDRIVAHLDGCSRCRQVLAIVSRSSTMLGDEGEEEKLPTRVGVDVLVGAKVGDYKVLERIAQGGMGVLYRGEAINGGKPVAIKVLLPEIASDPNAVGRLLGEARAVISVSHPNIVDIYALGQLPDGRHYMVMELLEGHSLSDVLKERGRLQPTEAVLVLEQAMAALVAAHAAGVIHRDMKPENLFVTPKPDGTWKVTLLDFGLAKQHGELSQNTSPDLVLGTPGFMAPEQIRGLETTTAIDVYAMGVVAWCMLTGREPYSGGSMVQVMKRHLDSPVPQLRTFIPGVPSGLEALVLQMMSKEPKNRPTAEEARKALVRLKHDDRRFVQSGELTQLAQPGSPLTVPEGVKPVPPTYTAETILADPDGITHAGSLPPAVTQTTRPDRPIVAAVNTVPEMPAVGEGSTTGVNVTSISGTTTPVEIPFRVLPLVFAALGLVLIGGAVGLVFFRPPPPPEPPELSDPPLTPGVVDPNALAADPPPAPPPESLVEVDPPRRTLSRAEVARSIAAVRVKTSSLSGPTRRAVQQQLSRLDDRLRKSEAPAAVAKDLEKLVGQYELK